MGSLVVVGKGGFFGVNNIVKMIVLGIIRLLVGFVFIIGNVIG